MLNNFIKKKLSVRQKAQVTLEFVFCFFVVMLIFYSCVKTLQWLGKALIGPHIEHARVYENPAGTIEAPSQMRTPIDQYTPLRLMYRNETFGGSY